MAMARSFWVYAESSAPTIKSAANTRDYGRSPTERHPAFLTRPVGPMSTEFWVWVIFYYQEAKVSQGSMDSLPLDEGSTRDQTSYGLFWDEAPPIFRRSP